ncbi:MG2 domain-containing protein [Inquilinus sp. CA228]|uniref:alpha-2-macroglobulin family protein n=1 Tax=Inquilinus sp. CA228 TaxID=3455609 RepID=UPI003F8D4391
MLALLVGVLVPAAALELPDIAADAERYRERLAIAPTSAGVSLATRLRAAKDAAQTGHWRQAVEALEEIVAGRPGDAETWLQLSRAWRNLDPNAPEGAAAAYNAFVTATVSKTTDSGVATEALLLIARHLESQERRELAIRTWAEIGRLISDPALEKRLAELRGSDLEFFQDGEETSQDGRTPKWCVTFSSPLDMVRQTQYQNWVLAKRIYDSKEEPWAVEIAIAGEQLCVYGLRFGEKYTVTLKAELAAADGRSLKSDRNVEIKIGDRAPDLAFKSDTLILPKDGRGLIPLKSVNVKKVTLLLLQITDRQLINEVALGRVGKSLDFEAFENIRLRSGRIVWWGSAKIDDSRNTETLTELPIGAILDARGAEHFRDGIFSKGFVDDGAPDALGNGVYALAAIPGNTTKDPLTEDDWIESFGYGTLESELIPTQWIVRTDIGLQLMRGSGGLHVVARSISEGMAYPGIRVDLVSAANRILGSSSTDADGIVSFAPGLAQGILGNRLRGVLAFGPAGDFAFLDTSGDALDLSDRNIAGRAAPGPLDAYVWTDRGIYRPGETVEVMVIVRNDRAMGIEPPPLRLRPVAPDQSVIPELDIREFKAGVAHVSLKLPHAAASGAWRTEIYAGNSLVGSADLQVKNFVPNRIELQVDNPDKEPITLDAPKNVKLHAKYLYGAPAAGLSGRYRMVLRRAGAPFKGFESFHFGGEEPQEGAVVASGPPRELPRTSEDGSTEIDVVLDVLPKAAVPLEANVRVQIDDTDGRPVGSDFNWRVGRPGHHWLGARVSPPAGAGKPAEIEIVAVDDDGRQIPVPSLKWQLFAEEEAFQWQRQRDDDSEFDYEGQIYRHLLRSGTLADGTERSARLPIDEPLGRYHLKLTREAGQLLTEISFTLGFESTIRSAGRPDLVKVILDNQAYRPGDTLTARIESAFPGELILAVASDRVHEIVSRDVDDEPVDISLTVDERWGPHPYLLATVFRPIDRATDGMDPPRAIGVASFAVHDPRSQLEASIHVPRTATPRRDQRVVVEIKGLRPGSSGYVALAAVDAGILSLTNYAPPDPFVHFHGPRRLGVEILDSYGRVITDQGNAAPLHSGGDVDLGSLRIGDYTWPRTVVWFSGITALDEQGRASFEVPVPDFLGRLQLMAVAWTPAQSGAAQAKVEVSDIVAAQEDLPLFMAPGDMATAGVDLRNLHSAASEYEISLSSSGPISIKGDTVWRTHLAEGERTRIQFDLVASPLDAVRDLALSHLTLRIRSIDTSLVDIERRWTLPVRPATRPTTHLVRMQLAPNQSLELTRDAVLASVEALAPATIRLRQRISIAPTLDLHLFKDESERPVMTTYELAARLTLLLSAIVESGTGVTNASALADEFNTALLELLATQRPEGDFPLYPGERDTAGMPELTAFILDTLLTGQEHGLDIPRDAIKSAGGYLRISLSDSDYACRIDYAYPLYVLVRLNLATFSDLDRMKQSCEDSEDPPSSDLASRAFTAAALHTFGFSEEDELSGVILPISMEQTGTLPIENLADLVYGLSGTGASGSGFDEFLKATQAVVDRDPELGLVARGKLALAELRRARSTVPKTIFKVDSGVHTIDSNAWNSPEIGIEVLNKSIRIENLGPQEIVSDLLIRGVPALPALAINPDPNAAIMIRRNVYRLDGGGDPDLPVDLQSTSIPRSELLAVVIEGKASEDATGSAVLVDLLPGGWRIEDVDLREGLALAPQARKQLRLDLVDQTAVRRRDFADDRFLALIDLDQAQRGFRFGYLVRAASVGRYIWPATTVEGVNIPSVQGRTTAGYVNVVPKD